MGGALPGKVRGEAQASGLPAAGALREPSQLRLCPSPEAQPTLHTGLTSFPLGQESAHPEGAEQARGARRKQHWSWCHGRLIPEPWWPRSPPPRGDGVTSAPGGGTAHRLAGHPALLEICLLFTGSDWKMTRIARLLSSPFSFLHPRVSRYLPSTVYEDILRQRR